MKKAVTEQKKVLDRLIILRLLKKESYFQIGEKKLRIAGSHNSYLEA
jgi:hypothetical protein